MTRTRRCIPLPDERLFINVLPSSGLHVFIFHSPPCLYFMSFYGSVSWDLCSLTVNMSHIETLS